MAKLILLFMIHLHFVNTAQFFETGYYKSIHLAKHLREKELPGITLNVDLKEQVEVQNVADFVANAFQAEKTNTRRKRAARPTGQNDLRPQSSLSYLNDSHTQIVIHWAGKNSDVIIALAKGTNVGHSGDISSDVFYSENYGKNFMSIKDHFNLPDGSPALLSQYFNNPILNSHYFFVDETNQYIFSTTNYGRSTRALHVPFIPRKIKFHKTNYRMALAMNDKDDPVKGLYLTRDFGLSWIQIQQNVRSFFWEEDGKYSYNGSCIYILRVTYDDLGNVIRSCNFFETETELLSYAHDFEIQGPYMFATRKMHLLGGSGYAHQMYVSYYREQFKDAQFPHKLNNLDYFVVDASEDQVFMCIRNDSSASHLYISNVNGTKFSLSLTDILYFNPNGSNADSWLKYYMDEPFADIHKVEGMRGVYIATQLIDHHLANDFQRTLITYDKGGEWQLVIAPARDLYDRSSECSVLSNCSLHLTQKFHRLYAGSRSSPILSKESAPGLIVATGSTGTKIHIDNSSGIFISTDAGYSWHQVLQQNHFFSIADHGGIIVAVNSYQPTNQLVYTTDEGETWHKYNFTTVPIRVYGLLTEPGESTTVVFLFGSSVSAHSWQVINLNMSSVFAYRCTSLDYKRWSLPDDTPFQGCLLGSKIIYEKRIPHTNCYNGRSYVRETTTQTCLCSREDFECDFGFKPDNAYGITTCHLDTEMDVDVYRVPHPCPEGQFYQHTRGYRKISGDKCSGGLEERYAPDLYACRVLNIGEFLLYSDGYTIKRMTLETSRPDEDLLQDHDIRNIGAFDYDYINSCLYWADNGVRKIQRLCVDGNHTVEAIHNSSISNIVSLAYDWEGRNIYWIDSNFKTIEVSKRDGRYRRQLIRDDVLVNPNNLVLDPNHGWMYWTDSWFGAPAIYRVWMDGTNSSIEKILSGPTVGRVGSLAIDHNLERLYWSDLAGAVARSAEFNGSQVTTVVSSMHPHYIGIYKDRLFWTDDNLRHLETSNKYDGSDMDSGFSFRNIQSLKIFDETAHRDGNSACREVPGCSQLCLLKPPFLSDKHGRNRTCRCAENSTLYVIALGGDEKCCQNGYSNISRQCIAPNTTCHANQFRCDNGKCISSMWKCDRDNDCGDESDENDCKYETCTADQFTCQNGRCIPKRWQCDFDNDCRDNSDEVNCEDKYPSCTPQQFRCTIGRCISKSWVCDFDSDCEDGSDERNCHVNETVCEFNEFECPTGTPHCIVRTRVCDGRKHCSDGADETNCTSYHACDMDQFRCSNGNCTYQYWVCDSVDDCGDNSDENPARCANRTITTIAPTPRPTTGTSCVRNTFQCANHVCIPAMEECDGVDDCGDNSDEYHCGTSSPHNCSYNEFQCRNHRCVPMWTRCDGSNNCGDFTDEMYCPSTTSSPMCGPTQFRCYNSSFLSCVYMSSVCDGYRDCPNGEDEYNCGGGRTCDTTRFFKCRHSEGCIPKRDICNEMWDCIDGSDESTCHNHSSSIYSNTTCHEKHYFSCKFEDKCIPYMYVCNAHMDCKHSSDENQVQCFEQVPGDNKIHVEEVQSDSVLVSWGPYNGRNVSYIVSVYASHRNGHLYTNITTGKTRYKISKLHPAKEYHITVYVNTSGTVLNHLEIITVTTLDALPDAPTELYATSDTVAKILTVGWWYPLISKGKIIKFLVYVGNSFDDKFPETKEVEGTTPAEFDSFKNNKFEIGKNYSIWVRAVTGAGVGPQANLSIVFGAEKINAYVAGLDCTPVGNHTMNVTWQKPATDLDKIDDYLVKYYDNLGEHAFHTTDFSFTATGLCSGIYYYFLVSPFSKKYGEGRRIGISKMTNGPVDQAPANLTVDLIGPTKVNVSWALVEEANKSMAVTIYYAIKSEDMYDHRLLKSTKQVKTTQPYIVIDKLLACEGYHFRVAQTNCSISPIAAIQTSFDEEASPENLKLNVISHTSLNVSWTPGCEQEDIEPTGYVVYVLEVMVHKETQSQPFVATKKSFLSMVFKGLKRGATYSIRVKNNNSKKSRISESVNVTMPAYQAPIDLEFGAAKETMVWHLSPDDKIPSKLFNGYEVLVCSHPIKAVRNCTENDNYMHYKYTEVEQANYSGLAEGSLFYFRVRLNKVDGYYGQISTSTLQVQIDEAPSTPSPTGPFGMTRTNLIAMIVSVSVVVIALAIILAFFIIRHKRLQRSFHAYASSHYDSRSGTTTFSAADDLMDEEEPMIQGFSDDEPLVIA